MSFEVVRRALSAAIRSHSDPDLTRQCEKELARLLGDGMMRGLHNPPTPPPSHIQEQKLLQWAERLASRQDGQEVILARLMGRSHTWRSLAPRAVARNALGKALRARGFTSQTAKRRGKAVRVFTQDVEEVQDG